MKIYLACALTYVPSTLFTTYVSFIHELATTLSELPTVDQVRYALVDSDPQLATENEEEKPNLCYSWDRRMVEEADLLVADATFPSTGLGIEMQIAEINKTPIILLAGRIGQKTASKRIYSNPDKQTHSIQIGRGIVSLMALGLPNISKVIEYDNYKQAIKATKLAVNLSAV